MYNIIEDAVEVKMWIKRTVNGFIFTFCGDLMHKYDERSIQVYTDDDITEVYKVNNDCYGRDKDSIKKRLKELELSRQVLFEFISVPIGEEVVIYDRFVKLCTIGCIDKKCRITLSIFEKDKKAFLKIRSKNVEYSHETIFDISTWEETEG